jgi:hypothetical protein
MKIREKRRYSSSLIRAQIIKGMGKSGCPICNLMHDAERKYINHVIYEMVNNPFYRKKLRESGGFCAYHSWLLVDLIESNMIPEKIGASIITKDLLEDFLIKIDKEDFQKDYKKGLCPVCEDIASLENSYIIEIVSWLRINCKEFLKEYENSKSILCWKHFIKIRERIENGECRERFSEIQKSKIKSVLGLIDSYLDKSRYDAKESISVEESEAYRLAIEILKGGKALIARHCV